MMSKVLQFFLSIRLTVICLIILSVLVVWGTLYQVEYGLYQAQSRFFDSWIIWLFDWYVPFPGTQLVLFVLFINLMCNMMLRFSYGWNQIGIVTIHMGLMLLLAGGFVTQRFGQESFLSLFEGEGSNLASDYHKWEISAYKDSGMVRDVFAYDADYLEPGRKLDFGELGFSLTVNEYHENARAFQSRDPALAPDIMNSSGITMLEGIRPSWEPTDNMPGVIFTMNDGDNANKRILLFGGDMGPTSFRAGDDEVNLILRRKRYQLPVFVRLLNFDKGFHPNTEIPKSFSSLIEIDVQGVAREALVEMNRPFRYQGYTFYQASYADLEDGVQMSTFAIALNYGRLIPYIATGITFAGLALHFMVEIYRRRR